MLGLSVDGLAYVNEAAATTGWSPRMLRYVERAGLVAPQRSAAGYRLYGAAELQRLRTLRELLERHDVGLADVGFARRMREDADLRGAVEEWLERQPARPDDVARRRMAGVGAAQARAPAAPHPKPQWRPA